jgi:hypothetical protein
MKKMILCMLPVFILGIFSSCDDDAKPDPETGCGMELKLVATKPNGFGNLGDVVGLSGENMTWQESIFLLSNATFVKHYEKDGVTSEEGGTYAYVTSDGLNFLELTYTEAKNPLIESCTTADSKERIQVISATELHGIWGQCDGPTLVYTKTPYHCED